MATGSRLVLVVMVIVAVALSIAAPSVTTLPITLLPITVLPIIGARRRWVLLCEADAGAQSKQISVILAKTFHMIVTPLHQYGQVNLKLLPL
ncbi:MAG UNVERIFIED_CONTAM: hypothetical protein LVT10_23550 [Anaerolineae bacterium]|jgi:hypothetical protein